MRRGFARVKWLPREIRKDLSSSQDLGERRVVVGGVDETWFLARPWDKQNP